TTTAPVTTTTVAESTTTTVHATTTTSVKHSPTATTTTLAFAVPTTPTIFTTSALPNTIVSNVNGTPKALTSSVPHAVFRVSSGTLPPGLKLNKDGTFSGKATNPGTYNVTVQACSADTGACETKVLGLVIRRSDTAIPKTLEPASADGPAKDLSIW